MAHKVLHISKYYYPFIGGTEQVARDIVRALSDTDTKQMLLCFNENISGTTPPYHRGETVHETVDDIDVVRCGCVAKLASQSISLTYARELRRMMDEFQPDTIVFHYPNPFVAHLLLKYHKRDFRLILYWHLDITKQKLLKPLFHRQNIVLIQRATSVCGATPKHTDESAYSQYFEGKKVLLPYTISEDRLVISEQEIAAAEQLRAAHAGQVLGFFVGRHVPYKGLRYLIEASHLLGDQHFHFFIAGDGELTESLKLLAKDDPKVEFVGRISDGQWRSTLYACDLFCFPSITRNEAFGLALAEGMYYGKPAITFTIPGSGVNFVNLDGVTGIECPNSDAQAYADALHTLGADTALREKFGAQARQRVLDLFSTAQFRKHIHELILQKD